MKATDTCGAPFAVQGPEDRTALEEAVLESGLQPVCIGLDLGSTAIKGVAVDAGGGIMRAKECPASYIRGSAGEVEYDAGEYWESVCGLMRELARGFDVRAVACSGASGNTLLADRTGTPLAPVVSWLDTRGMGQPLPPPLQGLTPQEVRAIAGWPCLDRFPLAHLAWFRGHKPELLDQAEWVGMNTDWLLFRMTGVRAMDYSTATTLHLLDQRRLAWHRPLLERLGIREEVLPPLTGSGCAVGRFTAAAASACGMHPETVGVTGAFDHPSAARAAGVLDPGQLLLSCGTSWVGFVPWQNRAALVEAGMLCDPFLSEDGGPWAGMFSVPAIGPSIDRWIREVIAPGEPEPLRVFDELAGRAAPGAGGLCIDPRQPPPARMVDRSAVARAVMEGAARALNELIERQRERGFRFTRAVLVGGVVQSPVWPEIIAQITGIEVVRGSVHAGALGAALLARGGCSQFACSDSSRKPSNNHAHRH